MKIVQINVLADTASTGRICFEISQCLNSKKIENYIIYQGGNSSYPLAINCSQSMFKFQALLSRIKGNYGFNSNETTKKIICELDRIKPDLIHLHNMHGHNCNLDILLNYIKDKKIKLVWTFHDCWTYTAYCPHYTMEGCYQWKTQCTNCPQIKKFSWFFDRSKWLFEKKRELFIGVDMQIVTPSKWLMNEVKQSFLKDKNVKVIYNGLDLNVFKPRLSDFREKYNIPEDKKIVLGVAIQWVPRKGADVFVELSKRLDNSKYQIVLVGTDENVERTLPDNIIAIRRTNSAEELAEIYTAADVFVNPTREEVLGMVNLESLACGTPVITFRTGGSVECIDASTGIVVDCDDIDSMEEKIIDLLDSNKFTSEDCINRAKLFESHSKFEEYVQLYESLLK